MISSSVAGVSSSKSHSLNSAIASTIDTEALRGAQDDGMTSLLIRKYERRLRGGDGRRTAGAEQMDDGR